MASETFEVYLQGGSPWGFRLQGGKEFRAPLLIAKVTPGSKALKEGILVGDLLVSINNEPCDDMTHSNALNCIKKSGKSLTLTLERRPFDGNEVYSYNSLPRGTKLTNGDVSNNNKSDFKSVEGYATLPRSSRNKNYDRVNHDYNVEPGDERDEHKRSDSVDTRSSNFSSKYSAEDDDLLTRAYGVMSPSNEEWSPDLISDAVRTPQPIRLISNNEPVSTQYSHKEPTRVKSPTTIHGFTDKPLPVGRGARRNNDEENTDSTDFELLNSGSSNYENTPEDDDSGKNSYSPPTSPRSQGHSRPAITHMVKRREGVPMPLADSSTRNWFRYHYIDDERKKKAAEQPYRRYSYHGSVLRDPEPKTDSTERPRIQAGSGWYKELFKEMHTGAGSSTGLSSLLAGDVSPPPKNDARGLFKSYRERAASAQEAGLRATKTQETHAEPSSSSRFTRPEASVETKQSYRHSMSSIPSATATVQMREKPTTRSNVPSWYRELQKGKEVSEEEINEDRKQPSKHSQAPGTTRSPGDIGPEYPVVRSFSLGTRSASAPVVHREPPKKMHTQNYQQRNEVSKATNRYSTSSRTERIPVQKEPDKPSATNLYEDHMRNRQFSPRPERRDSYEPVDYIKQFEEEEQKMKEDERRAKEELERKLREEQQKAKEEAEQRRREAEIKKKQEIEARKNPKHARALYNFTPQSSKEIGFRKGDIVLFYRSIDANWCEGEAQGQIGLYPTSYVEILEENVLRTEGEGKVKYNFKAESPRELNLQKGDTVAIIRQIDKNWYEGIKDEKIGIFPVSYIELLREPGESQDQVPPQRVEEEVIAKQNGLPEVESEVDGFPEPPHTQEPDIRDLDGETFTVVFTYSPQNEDELELLEGDIVKVVEKCDDGWYVGISERTGEFGTFPGNYVKQL